VARFDRPRRREHGLLIDGGDTRQATLTAVVSRGQVGVDVLRRIVRSPQAHLAEIPIDSRSIVREYLRRRPFRFEMRRWVHRLRSRR